MATIVCGLQRDADAARTRVMNAVNVVGATKLTTTALAAPETALRLYRSAVNGVKYNPCVDFRVGTHSVGRNANTTLEIALGDGPSDTPDTTVVTLDSTGDASIAGTASVGGALLVAGQSTLAGDIAAGAGLTVEGDVSVSGGATLDGLEVTHSVTCESLTASGTVSCQKTTYTSDRRAKRYEYVDDGAALLDHLDRIRVCRYNFLSESQGAEPRYGIIAQDAARIPGLVATQAGEIPVSETERSSLPDVHSVDTASMQAVLIATVKSLHSTVKSLQAALEEQTLRIGALEQSV